MGAHEVSPAAGPAAARDRSSGCASRPTCPSRGSRSPRPPMPNAFAVGRSPKTATVCVTTGLLDLLTPRRARGVLGHELTHIANRDVMVMTLASFFASIASFIVQMGFWFGGAFGGDDNDNGPGAIVVILVSAVVYVISFVLLQALSRYREFAADRGSAIITGRPSALISALMKIDGTMGRIPQRDLRAGLRRAGRLLHLPAQGQADRRPPCSRPTRRWSSGSPPCSGSRPSCRARPERHAFTDGFPRCSDRPAQAGQARAGPAVRDEHRLRDPGDRPLDHVRGKAAIVFQPLATADFESIVNDMEEVVRGTAGRLRHDRAAHRRLLRLPLAGPVAGRTSTIWWPASTPSAARSRPAATASACCARCSRSATSSARPLYWIYNYKRGSFYPFVPAGGRRATRQRARARAQGADRQRPADRSRARALVPALGDPDLSRVPADTPARSRRRCRVRSPAP